MAWPKKDDPPTHHPEPSPAAPPRPAAPTPSPAPVASPSSSHEPPRRTDRATIGPSIFIKGDLSGEEDLVIEGRVEGKVDLKQNNVTVGKNGKVHADVFGKVVTIEGEVTGNVYAREQAILRQSGAIQGNIQAPRVVLEDGSRFKGSIDMEAPKDMGGPPSRDREPRPEPHRVETSQVEAAGVKAGA
ncbi:MAG TPA: polymer-forming cytoskeletal protein [Thermoanaerobaculia bacterium]|nr:polymer-forming cytoskeletal protein [Thermoanaerobaculia bacterium]